MSRETVCLVAVLLGCSEQGSAGDVLPPAGQHLERESFFEQLRSSVCDEMVACRQYATRDECLLFVADAFGDAEAAIERGVVSYNGERSEECLRGWLGLFKCRTSEKNEVGGRIEACEDVVEGVVAMGDRCYFSMECASGECMADDPTCLVESCCSGVCVPRVAESAVGDPCHPDGNCGSGKYCSEQQTCAKYLVLGDGCLTGQCTGSLQCLEGTCQYPSAPARGEACSSACDSGADFCDPSTGRCEPRREPGAACTDSSQCVGYAPCEVNVCTPIRGRACDPNGGRATCSSGYQCVDNSCEPPTPTTCRG